MNFRKLRLMTVAHSLGAVGGKRIDYYLVKSVSVASIYGIKVSYNGQILERSLSSDLAKSVRLYETVVRNLVTPCTLDDVLEDCFFCEPADFEK